MLREQLLVGWGGCFFDYAQQPGRGSLSAAEVTPCLLPHTITFAEDKFCSIYYYIISTLFFYQEAGFKDNANFTKLIEAGDYLVFIVNYGDLTNIHRNTGFLSLKQSSLIMYSA